MSHISATSPWAGRPLKTWQALFLVALVATPAIVVGAQWWTSSGLFLKDRKAKMLVIEDPRSILPLTVGANHCALMVISNPLFGPQRFSPVLDDTLPVSIPGQKDNHFQDYLLRQSLFTPTDSSGKFKSSQESPTAIGDGEVVRSLRNKIKPTLTKMNLSLISSDRLDITTENKKEPNWVSIATEIKSSIDKTANKSGSYSVYFTVHSYLIRDAAVLALYSPYLVNRKDSSGHLPADKGITNVKLFEIESPITIVPEGEAERLIIDTAQKQIEQILKLAHAPSDGHQSALSNQGKLSTE